jgi:inosine-uridine nucleoside N-ribohydrolase
MSLNETERVRLLTPPQGKVRMVLDTDAFNEIDDQFAIVQALLSPDKVTVEALYAAPFSNQRADNPARGMELSFEEINRLLERLGMQGTVPVLKGVTSYVGAAKEAREAEAVDHLIAAARGASPQSPLYVVAIAAISNIASALLKAPDIIDRIVVIWLGGHALNWPDTLEFNLRQDIGGAQILLDSGVPLVLIPCKGITTHLRSTVPEIERYVEPCGDIGAFLSLRFKEYSSEHKGWSKEIWDMAAVGWLLHPESMHSGLTPAPLLTAQGTWSADPARHLIRYISYIERDVIITDFFNRLESHVQGRQPTV